MAADDKDGVTYGHSHHIRLHCYSTPVGNLPFRVVHCYTAINFFRGQFFLRHSDDTWVAQLKCIINIVGISFTSMKRHLLLPENYL